MNLDPVIEPIICFAAKALAFWLLVIIWLFAIGLALAPLILLFLILTK